MAASGQAKTSKMKYGKCWITNTNGKLSKTVPKIIFKNIHTCARIKPYDGGVSSIAPQLAFSSIQEDPIAQDLVWVINYINDKFQKTIQEGLDKKKFSHSNKKICSVIQTHISEENEDKAIAGTALDTPIVRFKLTFDGMRKTVFLDRNEQYKNPKTGTISFRKATVDGEEINIENISKFLTRNSKINGDIEISSFSLHKSGISLSIFTNRLLILAMIEDDENADDLLDDEERESLQNQLDDVHISEKNQKEEKKEKDEEEEEEEEEDDEKNDEEEDDIKNLIKGMTKAL
ncbi:MAG: hypothetical protein KAS12_01275 [Candidatus Aenigmarchaeota archaeon]|nr:hypothetical protein [Candidatus Aenigmarchaeota archaeon]